MNKVTTDDLDLKKKWWHRLIMVLFVIFTIFWIIIAIVSSDWDYAWRSTFFNVLIGILVWLIVTNLIYYEWMIYIITGEHWNSFFRKWKKHYNKLTIEKRRKLLKIVWICVGWLLTIKLIICPIVSNIFSSIGNNILYTANEEYKNWWDDITVQEKNKAKTYCKIWKFFDKSAKNLMCFWDLAYYNDSYYESVSYYKEALNFNPNLKDKIDIMITLGWAQMFNKETYSAKSTLEAAIPLLVDVDKYADYYNPYFVRIYIGLWLLSDKYSDAMSACMKALPFAKTHYYKWMFYFNKARIQEFFWYYYDALQTLAEMRETVTLNSLEKQDVTALETEIKGKYSVTDSYYGIPTAE